MSSYIELKNQAAELLRQAEELRAEERAKVVAEAKAMVNDWGISASELGFRNGRLAEKRTKLPAKYRDNETGYEWCGRGAMPNWLVTKIQAGSTKEQFLI